MAVKHLASASNWPDDYKPFAASVVKTLKVLEGRSFSVAIFKEDLGKVVVHYCFDLKLSYCQCVSLTHCVRAVKCNRWPSKHTE